MYIYFIQTDSNTDFLMNKLRRQMQFYMGFIRSKETVASLLWKFPTQ
jgi:hypothetical protein